MNLAQKTGFETESDLAFSTDAIGNEDVWEDGDVEESLNITSSMFVVVEDSERKKTEMKISDRSVEIPSFFDSPTIKNSNIFDVEFFAPTISSQEGCISLDLDNEDPLLVASKVKDVYLSSQIKADICKYLNAEDFEQVNFDDLAGLIDIQKTGEEREPYLRETIERLIFNQDLKSKKEFLKKLYKLRPTETLIKEALMVETAIQKSHDFKTKVKELIIEWEKSVKEKIKKDFYDYQMLCNMQNADNREFERQRQTNDVLRDEYENKISEMASRLQESRAEYEYFLSKISNLIDIDDDNKTPNEILSLLTERIKQSSESDPTASGQLEHEVASLKEELEIFSEMNSDIEASLQEALSKNRDLITQIEALKNENNILQETATLKCKTSQDDKNQVLEKIEVQDEEDEEDEESEEETKKSSKTKNIIISTVAVLVMVAGLFLFLSWFIGEDTPAKPANYVPVAEVKAAEKPASAPNPTEIAPQPSAALTTTAEPAQNTYNFDVKLSELEFQNQKFDIYIDNFEKIRINGRDFMANDLINSYRFIKATAGGKILFIKENKEPFWVEMK